MRGSGELRLLIRSRANLTPQRVAAILRAILGASVRAEPLYLAKSGRRSASARTTEFLARVQLSSAALRERNPFDVAHTVRDESNGEFVWVEPDILQRPRQGFDDMPSASENRAATARSAAEFALSDLCLEHVEPPADRYWHLRAMNADGAWEVSRTQGTSVGGAGIRIGHLDTGWTRHPELFASLDFAGQFDFVDNDGTAQDELAKGNPFHGSRTGSVIASTFAPPLPPVGAPFPGDMAGTAPAAKLVPIRVVKSVIVFFNGDVARGIDHATRNDCHVISMSLGGVAGDSLHEAVRRAVRANVIVCAAAGNCVGIVVVPARYPESIAVAAVNARLKPWKGSSRGREVDVAAPGAQVWTAARPTAADPRAMAQGEGTSFAVAGVAGIAALWLAHHGRAKLLAKYQAHTTLQDVFRHLLRLTAKDIGLPKDEFGAGLVDAKALLEHELPEPADVVAAHRVRSALVTEPGVFDDLLGGIRLEKRRRAVATRGDADAERRLLAQEFAQLCFDHPNAYRSLRRGRMLARSNVAASEAERAEWLDTEGIAKYASERLRERLVSHRVTDA